MIRRALGYAALGHAAFACGPSDDAHPGPREDARAPLPSASSGRAGGEGSTTVVAPSLASASASGTVPAPPPDPVCGDGMRHVSGGFCPSAEHVCLAWDEVVGPGGKMQKNQCRTYRAPALCHSPTRTPMSFCMDTYEYPNVAGTIPQNLTSWQEAKDTCERIGKRLCSPEEFTFACEGDAINPHVTGFVRDGAKCSYDRPYRPRTFAFAKREACAADPACTAALAAIDQRIPAGSMPACTNDFGIYDLNGNVNEWVEQPGKGFAKRAGLKGGWWGPVRDRCRPMTTFHGESDFGYEVGFRCCKDAPSRS